MRTELQHLSQLDCSSQGLIRPVGVFDRKAEDYNRSVAIHAAKQPGYGKRVQLIPDGLQDPNSHLEAALRLEHPFNRDNILKAERRGAIKDMTTLVTQVLQRRLRTLGEFKAVAQSEQTLQMQAKPGRAVCQEVGGRNPRTALMEAFGRRYQVEDTHVPKLCLTGMPIIGKTLESPFYLPDHVPAATTISELLRTAPMRRLKTIGRVKVMARSGGLPLSMAIYEKTLQEVSKGTMAGPFNLSEVIDKHGKFVNIIPSFGLQGAGNW